MVQWISPVELNWKQNHGCFCSVKVQKYRWKKYWWKLACVKKSERISFTVNFHVLSTKTQIRLISSQKRKTPPELTVVSTLHESNSFVLQTFQLMDSKGFWKWKRGYFRADGQKFCERKICSGCGRYEIKFLSCMIPWWNSLIELEVLFTLEYFNWQRCEN